jgi:hypothetical protein
MAPDDHMASTNDDGRGVVSFEITKKKPNKKAQSKKSKNKKNKGVAGGVAPGGAVPSGGGVKVDDGSEGVLIPSAKGKERADTRAIEMDEKTARSGEGESDEPVVKKKVVDRLSDKNRELVSPLLVPIINTTLLLTGPLIHPLLPTDHYHIPQPAHRPRQKPKSHKKTKNVKSGTSSNGPARQVQVLRPRRREERARRRVLGLPCSEERRVDQKRD